MEQRQPQDHSTRDSYGVAREEAKSPDPSPPRVGGKRPWLPSTVGALLVVGLVIVISVLVNPLLGRYTHWRRIDFGAPVVFLGLTLALRRRWV